MFKDFVAVMFYLLFEWVIYMVVFLGAATCFGWGFNLWAATLLWAAIGLVRTWHRKESKK